MRIQIPEIYNLSTFSDHFIPPDSYDIVFLPVEQFIYRSKLLRNSLTLTYGSAEFLEDAFLLGAADYLKEPWDCRELQIRMNHICTPVLVKNKFCTVLILDAGIAVNERIYYLSRRELKILSLLGSNKNTTIAYKTLSRHINIKSSAYENTLYVTISRLRKKLRLIDPVIFPAQLDIKNISGEGYILVSPCG